MGIDEIGKILVAEKGDVERQFDLELSAPDAFGSIDDLDSVNRYDVVVHRLQGDGLRCTTEIAKADVISG